MKHSDEHAQEKHPVRHTRSLVPALTRYVITSDKPPNLIARTVAWCFPWTNWRYPGIERGMLSLMPRPFSGSSLRAWRQERNRLPLDVALSLADYIESRCRVGIALVKELRHYAKTQSEKPKHNQGFMQIRERNGITSDARGKGARKK